jgi:nanoRNase/pAp phosphatase (c-di-AMP/oligoRNAs hydrolase)
LINQVEASFMDESMATQLLTGIITETDSFQHVRTTPQTFLKASQLVGLGANQQEIISRLYKSKSLGLLKLWGRVLARLKHISDITLVYSSISKNDMAAAEATEADSNQIIKEMVSQLGFAKLFLLSKETETNRTAVYFHTTLPLNTASLFSKFIPKPISFQTWRLSLELPVAEAERQIIQILTEEMGKYKVGA